MALSTSCRPAERPVDLWGGHACHLSSFAGSRTKGTREGPGGGGSGSGGGSGVGRDGRCENANEPGRMKACLGVASPFSHCVIAACLCLFILLMGPTSVLCSFTWRIFAYGFCIVFMGVFVNLCVRKVHATPPPSPVWRPSLYPLPVLCIPTPPVPLLPTHLSMQP